MEHLRMRAWGLGLAVVAIVSASVAVAQPQLPRENHYKVYNTFSATYLKPVLLTDQFGSYLTNVFVLERWGNPAEKRVEEGTFPPVDPFIHQTWWRADLPFTAPRDIVVIDQFGAAQWRVSSPVYLVNPALKNVPGGQPPIWNHYLCYDAEGPQVGRVVILIDQFGGNFATVLFARFFCNPVEKRHLDDGLVYPILDYKAHLACYLMDSPDPFAQPIVGIDQFGNWQMDVYQPNCLCVPALKEHVVKTEESTWGKIKALYN